MLVSLSMVMVTLSSISCNAQTYSKPKSSDCLSNICDSLSKNSIRNNTLLEGVLSANSLQSKMISEYPMFIKEVQLNDSTKYLIIISRQINKSK